MLPNHISKRQLGIPRRKRLNSSLVPKAQKITVHHLIGQLLLGYDKVPPDSTLGLYKFLSGRAAANTSFDSVQQQQYDTLIGYIGSQTPLLAKAPVSSHSSFSSTPPKPTMSPPIILFNGWPGVGKETVAETLKLLLGDDKACLVDWSKGQRQADWTFQPVAEDDVVAQKAQRDACFTQQVEHASLRNKIVICTDCLPDTPEGRRLAQDFEVVANRGNRLLIPVYLDCGLAENMRRIANLERRVSLKDKSEFFPRLDLKVAVGSRGSAGCTRRACLNRQGVTAALRDRCLGTSSGQLTNVISILVRSPNEARTVRSNGGKLYTYPRLESITVDNTSKVPHEAALQILSFMRELVYRRDEALVNDETTPHVEASEPTWS